MFLSEQTLLYFVIGEAGNPSDGGNFHCLHNNPEKKRKISLRQALFYRKDGTEPETPKNRGFMKKYGFAADEMVKIIDAHFAPLLLYARQWDAAVAEDLVQEAFLKLLRQSHKKGCPENVTAWLFQVVRNGAVSWFRKNSRREKHERNHGETRIMWSEPAQEAAIEGAELAEMLDQLPLEQRELVILRIWAGLSFDEMVTLTGMSRTTVFRKYNEALETLRKKLH